MRTELKLKLSYNKTLLILSALCILSSCLSLLAGDLVIPLVAGFFAAILVIETGKKRIFSYILPLVMLLINALGVLLLNSGVSLWSVASAICGFLIYLAYTRDYSKFNFSLVITAVITVCTVLSLLFIGMIESGQFSLSASLDYFGNLRDSIRTDMSAMLVELFEQIYADTENIKFTLSDAEDMIDATFNTLVSVLIVFSFAICGLCLKLFSAVMKRCLEYEDNILGWRFDPPAMYGHIFIVLMFVQFIASYGDGVFSFVITNLYLIFVWIYAYIGYRVAIYVFSNRKKPAVITAIIILLLLLFSSLALQILALLGAFSTTRRPPQTPANP